MMEIKEYRLINCQNSPALERSVENYMNEGFQPYGYPFAVTNFTTEGLLYHGFAQAMVIYQPEEVL